ncbi:MAG: hypothetical protein JWN89_552 [Parcubacteria group bacterium]|nr:hypothetical protein [Parcubacteria group bacterium]
MSVRSTVLFLVGILLIGGSIFYFLKQPAPDRRASAYAYDSSVCNTDSDKSACLSTFYAHLVDAYGAKTAIEDLKTRGGEDQSVMGRCHPYMHTIGESASEKYKTVSEAYLYGDPFCWSGYYHGVLEGVTAKIGEEKLLASLNSICADIPGKGTYSFNYYNCVHGLGHGIMELKGDELFDSLKTCDSLIGDWEQQSCQSGVFMENVILYTNYGKSAYLKPEEPLYPCTAVEDKYKYQCYLGQTSFALEASQYDFKKVADLCTTVKGQYRDICFQSLGRDAANQAGHGSPKTRTTCDLASIHTDRMNCYVGAVKEFISYYHSITEANGFCGALDEADKTSCVQTGEEYYKAF